MQYALNTALKPGSEHENNALLSRHHAYRQAFRSWTSAAVRRLSDDALQHCAQHLDTAQNGELVAFAQREWPVLLDYAIYCHRLAGESTIQHLRAEHTAVSTDADRVLTAMCEARILVLDLDEVFKGVGFRGVDVWSGAPVEVVEPAIATRFREGDRLICRVFDLPDLSATTELLMPLSDGALFRLVDELDLADLDPEAIHSPSERDEYARVVYRCALDDLD